MMTNKRSLLKVDEVSVAFKQKDYMTDVLSNVCLQCNVHEIVAIIGKSGSGKTSLLKAVAGLIPISSGSIELEGNPISGSDRERGMVFQEYCVFPWLTVKQNIELGARCGNNGNNMENIKNEVDNLLNAIGLFHHQNKWPFQLSGGMQQRVAIARTLAADPALLLLDEPFGALDAITRINMQKLIQKIFMTIKQGILLVTHDIREAVLLADKVALLSGTPATIKETWKIPFARTSPNPLKLQYEQENIVNQILTLLHEDNGSN